MVNITFYGGVGEIGGNKILLEDDDSRILLDFGMNFVERSKFYSEPWLSPRDERGLLEFGLLPQVSGLYKFDDKEPEIDAVFLSHSHTDHTAYISFLNRKIPVYCGETTALILQAFSEINPKSFDNDIQGLQFRTFHTGDKIKLGSVEVEPIHVDHSVPGSYGFIVHTTEGAVIYSGDFRLHGTKPQMTEEFVEAAAATKPIALLCEGTNLVGADYATEQEVNAKLGKVVSTSQNLVLAAFRHTDIDRTRTLSEVASRNHRRLAISLRQAYVLNKLKADKSLEFPPVDSSDFLIFKREKKTYYKWEQAILGLSNVVDAEQVQRIQNQVILATGFADLKELLYMRPDSGSSFVLSSSEPFNEEMEIEYDKFVNWLDHFGLPMFHIHCSGHIMPTEVKQVITKIAPATLFPIHTEHPELYSKFVHDVTKVKLPQKATTYQFQTNGEWMSLAR
jgi:ribonuclease J